MCFVACHVNSKLQNFAAVRTICCTGNTHALASFRHPSVTRHRASRGKPGTHPVPALLRTPASVHPSFCQTLEKSSLPLCRRLCLD